MDRDTARKLVLILLCSIPPRLFYFTSEFVRSEEWGLAQFSVFAKSYHKFGLLATKLLPTIGMVHGEAVSYANHPPGASLLLGVWTALFGHQEYSARLLALLISLLTTVVICYLGSEIFRPRVGLLAAFLHAFMPLSVYLGRTYSLEPLNQLLTLVGLLYGWRYFREGRGRELALATVFFFLGSLADYYTVYLTPYLVLLALLVPERRKGFLLLGLAPVLAIGSYVVFVSLVGALDHVRGGASDRLGRIAYFWTWNYQLTIARRLFWFSGILPLGLAILAPVKGWARSGFWERDQKIWLGLMFCLPFFDWLVLSEALAVHPYRVLYFLVPIALLAARVLDEWRYRAIFLGLFLLLSFPTLNDLYRPLYRDDPATARQIRQLTSDRDILIGLPSHMSYYIDRPAMVPYNYTWKYGNVPAEEVFAKLHRFARPGPYDRIVLFTQFLNRHRPIEWWRAFEGVEGLKRTTEPGVDPQVWEFESTPQ